MTLQSGGAITFGNKSNEFGLPPGKNIGAYRVSENVGSLTALPLDTGVPQTGAIKFSDFYNKKLNIVVDLHSIPDYSTRLTARVRYNDQNVRVIGGFTSRPASSADKRVIINVNKIIGSDQGGQANVALRTGGWESNTQLEMEIGSGGLITGAGGNGGYGSYTTYVDGVSNGTQGSSALGVEYPTTIRNSGYIQSGYGGGGGGALAQGRGSCQRTQRGCQGCQTPYAYGGGGAGGRGYPSGSGGGAPGNGSAGSGGTLTGNGGGGAGGNVYGSNCSGCGAYGQGGDGGGAMARGGGSSSCWANWDSAGYGGAEGYAIIFYAAQGSTLTNNGGSTSGPITDPAVNSGFG